MLVTRAAVLRHSDHEHVRVQCTLVSAQHHAADHAQLQTHTHTHIAVAAAAATTTSASKHAHVKHTRSEHALRGVDIL